MNPAYAGSKESLSMGLLHRRQWVDIEGAPTTSTFLVIHLLVRMLVWVYRLSMTS